VAWPYSRLWCDEGEMPVSLLSLGICDAPAWLLASNAPLWRCLKPRPRRRKWYLCPITLGAGDTVLLDQLERKPAQFQAIAADMHRFLSDSTLAPTAEIGCLGALLSVLQRSPIQDSYSLLTPSGTVRTEPPMQCCCRLSWNRNRSCVINRSVTCADIAAPSGGRRPVFRAWLGSAFETVKRSIDDIHSDYLRLLDAHAKRRRARERS